MSYEKTEVLIIGAGIGGACAALALARAGVDVVVAERAAELRAVGAGLTIQANAAAVLDGLGLTSGLEEIGRPIRIGQLRDGWGKIISEADLGAVGDRVGAQTYGVHRGPMLDLLAAEMIAAGAKLVTGAELVRFEESPDGVSAEFADGAVIEAGVLIGADGIWSRVREELVGGAKPRYAGYTTWRGIAPVSSGETLCETWGPGLRFGTVPITGDQTYWFAVADAREGGEDGADVKGELLERFAELPGDVRVMIDATAPADILRTDCHDRPPLKIWGRGRVTLLGDAAHAMTPNMGQGACQAIEDAAALAAAFRACSGDPVAALRAYEAARIERANWFVDRSWKTGRLAHGVKNALLRRLRDSAMRLAPASVMEAQLERVFAPSSSR